MLRVVDPDEIPPETAYLVPWHLSFDAERYRVVARNEGADILSRVMVTLLGTGEMLVRHALLVVPGDAVTFSFPAHAPRESAVALLAWTTQREEYLYRVAR